MDFTQTIIRVLINPIFWIVGVLLLILGFYFILKIRLKRMMRFPAAEIVDLGGNGKTSINFLGDKSAGWVGKNLLFFKLWTSGEPIMRIKDLSIIEQFSEQDFQEVNGRRGVIFYRDPVSRLLFPINKLEVKNRHLVSQIAPAEYTDASLSIIRSAERETSGWQEKILPLIAAALVVILVVIALALVIQYAKSTQQEASKLLVDVGSTCMSNAKQICSEIVNEFAKTSTAP